MTICDPSLKVPLWESNSSWLGEGKQDERKTYIKRLVTRIKEGGCDEPQLMYSVALKDLMGGCSDG